MCGWMKTEEIGPADKRNEISIVDVCETRLVEVSDVSLQQFVRCIEVSGCADAFVAGELCWPCLEGAGCL